MVRRDEGTRIIITVLGKDRVGIIAGISTILAEAQINILDINQTIIQGFFTMVMVADMAASNISIVSLRETLDRKGKELGLQIMVQHEDIFNYMHRI